MGGLQRDLEAASMNPPAPKKRIAFVISHPIQYFSPFFRLLAQETDLTVFYCSKEGFENMRDAGFGRDVKWDVPLLDGYSSEFLKNISPCPTVFRPPWGLINPDIFFKIKKGRYDAVVVHGWHYATHFLAILAAIFSGSQLLVRAETPLSQERLKPKWKTAFKKTFFYFLRKKAVFLAIGEENKKFYLSMGVSRDRIFDAPYSVDNERLHQAFMDLQNKKSEIRERMGISAEKTVILFAGKLIAKKNPLDLLRAYERISLKNKALVYVGDGALKNVLKEYADQNRVPDVFFEGFKNQTEMPEYYRMADIFVLPSGAGETWGLVVNEAMNFGLPAVVSDLAGCASDLVKEGENGSVYPCQNIPRLQACLENLIENPALRERMSQEALKKIQGYSYPAAVRGILRAIWP